MRILFATFWQIPHVGGVWKYMNQLKNRYELLGHTVDIIGFTQGHKALAVINRNIFIPTPAGQPPMAESNDPIIGSYSSLLDIYINCFKQIDLSEYNVIHAQDIFSSIAVNRLKHPQTATVTTMHGCVAQEIIDAHYNGQIENRSIEGVQYFCQLEKQGAEASDCTIVANRWMYEKLISQFDVSSQQLNILHYGYDIEAFTASAKETTNMKKPRNKKVIIFTGRFTPFKGVRFLIEALSMLKKTRHDWVCWLVGSGPEENELKKLVKEARLEKDIVFLGQRDDIPALLQQSDMLILPTLIENQPLSVIEAQLSGKAIIASQVGGVPEMIQHGMTGMLVPPKNAYPLYETIAYLLQEPAFLNNLGMRAKHFADDYWRLDPAIDRVIAVYQKALKTKQI
ncbi:glycosyltransferase family 4 protein [Cytobacillus kochii]|uniref:glycosyltransferase family 4 protein n=1 Tax=Cytobacillus kochii TaxID=859143 RepID=UPI0024808753|nr:glycosyltransferase family 4 protein [Cytobacillus kochii]MDM5207490.1 glycosyltransferase family 4 protein [Cytobacillus kochii]